MIAKRQFAVPALAVAVGLAGGLAFVAAGANTSPVVAIGATAVLLLGLAMVRYPVLGLYLTAAVVPLERLGRFTDDSSAVTFSAMRVVGLLALGGLLVHAAVRRIRLRFGAPFWLYAVYAGFCLTTILHTTHRSGTIRACGAIIASLMFFFLVVNLARDYRLAERAVAVWLVATVLIGLYTIADWRLGEAPIEEATIGETRHRFSTVWRDVSEWEHLGGLKRAMGSTSHAAVYGINLILTLPFFAYLFRRRRRRTTRAALAAGAAVVAYNIFLTNTRAAILLAGLVVAMILAARLFRPRVPDVLVGLLVLVALLAVMPPSVYERVLDPDNYSFEASGTARIRLEYWKGGLEISRDHWLTGVGVGNQNVVPKYVKGYGPKQTTVHNEYLQTFMEVGVFGWLAHFGFVGLVLWQARRAARFYRSRPDAQPERWFLVAAQIAMVGVLIYGLQVDVFHFPLKGWWLIAGIASAMYLRAREMPAPCAAPKGGQEA